MEELLKFPKRIIGIRSHTAILDYNPPFTYIYMGIMLEIDANSKVA